jgi:DNA repair exonuclease SbcCD ATPase subunit
MMQSVKNIESFMDEDFGRTLEGQIISMRTLIQGKQSALASAKATLSAKDAELIKLDKIYRGVAGEEKVQVCGTCPFVKNAADYVRLPKDIAQLRLDIVQMDKDLSEFALKADNISELKSLYQTFTTNYEQMGPRTNQVYIYFSGNHGKLMEVVSGSINDLTKAVNDVVSRINAILYSLQETTKLDSEIENLRFKKSISENNEKLKKDAEESLAEKKSRLDTLKKSLADNSKELSEKRKKFSEDELYFSEHKEHLEGRKERASLATQISTLTTTRDETMARKAELTDKTKKLAEINSRLADSRKRRSDTGIEVVRSKSSLSNVENLIARKTKLERDYEGLRLLKDALDPNKGVPLYFIKSYLEKTKDIANELLELAFGGDFEINFYTNEKEFFIQVRAGENVKNDIKEASQGEVALTTISISLALIEQAIGKYNVLCLDEIDGPLDQVNRSKFIDILTKQVGKLGIEQVFVISHNDAFDTEEMDLVLLRGSNVNQKGDEFMRNKTIIFEFKE